MLAESAGRRPGIRRVDDKREVKNPQRVTPAVSQTVLTVAPPPLMSLPAPCGRCSRGLVNIEFSAGQRSSNMAT